MNILNAFRYPAVVLLMLALAMAGCSLGADQQAADENSVITLESGGAAASDPTPLNPDSPEIIIPDTDCTVNVPREAYVFDAPAFSANRQTTLQGPMEFPGLARTESYWFEIEYPAGQRGAWVNSSQVNFGNDMTNDSRCQSLPLVTVEVTECVATNITSEVQTIYTGSSLNEYLGRFHPNNTLVVLSRSNGALEVWVGAFALEGWIDANIANLSGDCEME